MTHLLQGEERSNYVRDMFGRISNRYDLMNRLMTFGQDMKWRNFVIDKAQVTSQSRLLDLATGTGDIAFTALDKHPGIQVIGTDFALPMMTVGRERHPDKIIDWCQGDALCLPFPSNSFDAIVSGYLLRNLVDLQKGLQEQIRTVRPGGIIVALDTTPPPHNIFYPFIKLHLKYVIPLLGRLVTDAPDAYEYLPNSTQAFKSPEELTQIMIANGLTDVQHRTFMLGTMAVHWGRKPAV